MKTVWLCLIVCACSSAQTETATLGDLVFTAPLWQRHDLKAASQLTAELTPSDNVRKESISIIRTSLRGTAPDTNADALAKLLVAAQATLPSARVAAPQRIETKTGLAGVQVETDFVPVGLSATYHRVHAVIASGSVLVHVLYTARDADPDLEMFHVVLDGMRRGEG